MANAMSDRQKDEFAAAVCCRINIGWLPANAIISMAQAVASLATPYADILIGGSRSSGNGHT